LKALPVPPFISPLLFEIGVFFFKRMAIYKFKFPPFHGTLPTLRELTPKNSGCWLTRSQGHLSPLLLVSSTPWSFSPSVIRTMILKVCFFNVVSKVMKRSFNFFFGHSPSLDLFLPPLAGFALLLKIAARKVNFFSSALRRILSHSFQICCWEATSFFALKPPPFSPFSRVR